MFFHSPLQWVDLAFTEAEVRDLGFKKVDDHCFRSYCLSCLRTDFFSEPQNESTWLTRPGWFRTSSPLHPDDSNRAAHSVAISVWLFMFYVNHSNRFCILKLIYSGYFIVLFSGSLDTDTPDMNVDSLALEWVCILRLTMNLNKSVFPSCCTSTH